MGLYPFFSSKGDDKSKRTNSLIGKKAKHLNIDIFSKKDRQMANKHPKFREMLIKTSRYHFIRSRMVVIKKKKKTTQKTANIGKDAEKLEPVSVAGGKYKTV